MLAALRRAGWREKRVKGSHRLLGKAGYADFTWSFHDSDEIGPRMLARVAKETGLRPEDL